MACGCSSKPERRDARSCMAMCHVCDKRDRKVFRCTMDGRMIEEKAKDADSKCEMGFWPWPDGIILWLDLAWRGVPWPVRLWIGLKKAWAGIRAAMKPGYFEGCGCLDAVKKEYESVTVER